MLCRFVIKINLRLLLFCSLQLLIYILRRPFQISQKKVLVKAVDVNRATLTLHYLTTTGVRYWLFLAETQMAE